MYKAIRILSLLITTTILGQEDLTKHILPIVEEGKQLYRSEIASWRGTDLFLKEYQNQDSIGGYLSYTKNGVSKCIFFSKSSSPVVLGTITFKKDITLKNAKIDISEREFTTMENDLYTIRKTAISEISSDSLFKRYDNTNFNIIPLITNHEKKVYVLTATTQDGVVLFGNDYVLTFDQNNTILQKKRLHSNLIPVYYKNKKGKRNNIAMHTHLPETGNFITPTDICTLMLYKEMTNWKFHGVVSGKYINIWNCKTDTLTIEVVDQ